MQDFVHQQYLFSKPQTVGEIADLADEKQEEH